MRKHRQEPILAEGSNRDSAADVRRLHRWMIAVLAAILILAVLLGVLLWRAYQPGNASKTGSSASGAAASVQSAEVLSEPDNSWALTVVSQDQKADNSLSPQLVTYENIQVDSRILPALKQMLAGAKAAGYTLTLSKGYVDAKTQENLYQQEITDLMQKQNKTRAVAESDAAALVPPGGCSENQTGLAVTFPSDQTFLDSDAYHWLLNHCVDYGFVRRYTDAKEGCTGLKDDPSHFRYVGPHNAQTMRRLSLCLEEYVTYLDRQNSTG
ncbi:MAG: M15 family metallopeptidase [Oscillospiraceae bacterium]|jgi:D-alanyl-D-alanine carboxypeptidase|nr:M15 family metallopeptidase [Oscillospiraceae bacterium]MDD3260852.1 M15 family metallopeptidase [Oscillospiraceae bacterium]